LNPHSLQNAAQFNTIVTGISLRSTPFTIFIVSHQLLAGGKKHYFKKDDYDYDNDNRFAPLH
jgi:hypothetical protein